MPTSSQTRRVRTSVILTVIFGLQMAGSFALTRGERAPAATTLRLLPAAIGGWNLVDERALEPDVTAYLRPDDYINRTYANKGVGELNLFVAYFKSLKSGYGPHSPATCLPGAGWKPVEFKNITVSGIPGGIPVNQYILEKDGQSILVWYWYQNERRVWAEEFRAKLYMLPDILRYRRSDVALVRLIMPLNRNHAQAAESSLSEFVRSSFPFLAERFASRPIAPAYSFPAGSSRPAAIF